MSGKDKKSERKEIITETITEMFASEKTYFRKSERMKVIIRRETNRKLKELKMERLTPTETALLSRLTSAISKRDDKVFDEICHRLRNRLSTLGGFAARINRLTKEIKTMSKTSSKVGIDSEALVKEIKLTEKEMQNKRGRINRSK